MSKFFFKSLFVLITLFLATTFVSLIVYRDFVPVYAEEHEGGEGSGEAVSDPEPDAPAPEAPLEPEVVVNPDNPLQLSEPGCAEGCADRPYDGSSLQTLVQTEPPKAGSHGVQRFTNNRGEVVGWKTDKGTCSGGCRSTSEGDDDDGGSLVFVLPTPTPTPVRPAGNWLKVVGGDVYSGGRINMTVPPPAGQFNATGVVTSGSSITNFRTVSNWMIQNYSITSVKFDYEYFFKRFKSKALPLSTHIANSTSLDDETIYLYDQLGDLLLESNGANFNNKKIAILINGNLRIQNSGNKFTPQNASVIFITSGNVLIEPNMTELSSAIVSTGNTSTGTGAIPLTIKGLLVSYGGFSLGRAPSSSATPGETLIYDPNLVITLNDLIGMTNFFWQEVAP